jgi:hypothetical protein
MMQDHCSKEHS